MQNFFHRIPFSRWELGTYGILLVVLGGLSWWRLSLAAENTDMPPPPAKSASADTEARFETITPHISLSFGSQHFVGRVLSNSFAMIHPRREGVIKDIFVDVGDRVSAGQTVATLLPRGVEGQSSADILRAQAEVESARQALQNTRSVATESVAMAEENQRILTASQGGERPKLHQEIDQAQTVIGQELERLRRIFLGPQTQPQHVSNLPGFFANTRKKQQVFNDFHDLWRKKELGISPNDLPQVFRNLLSLLQNAESLYQTARSPDAESDMQTIQMAQSRILATQEKLDNVRLAIETTEQSLVLTQSKSVEALEQAHNRLEIAEAAYQAVLASQGHQKISAPFSGTIVRRLADVGHQVMPTNPVFEMTGAQTSLGKKSKEEIRFEVDSETLSSLEIGTVVSVRLPQANVPFSAIITRKSNALDPNTNTAAVHATWQDATVQPLPHNTRVLVLVQKETTPILSVPSTSLKRKGNENFLWVVDEKGNPRHLAVTILAEDGELSDVRSPLLTLHSQIIANPSVRLWRESTPLDNPEIP